jgi:hypothetical protein
MADGHIDLSGVWFSGPTGKANAWSVVPDKAEPQAPVPFRPEVEAKIKSMSRTELQIGNPQVACRPLGVPGMFVSNPYPLQIITVPGLFVHLIESNNNWRTVHTDGRAHPPKEEWEPLYNGLETAKWEGDVLVIDSVSFDLDTWVQGNGWPRSDETRVIERLRRPSKNYLEYQYTIEDPKVLTKPWTSSWRQYSLGQNEDLTENFCTNNENYEQLLKLNEIEQQKK